MALRWIDSFDYLGGAVLTKYDPVASTGVRSCDPPGRHGVESSRRQYVGRCGVVSINDHWHNGDCGRGGLCPGRFVERNASAGHYRNSRERRIQMGVGPEYSPVYGAAFKFTVVRGGSTVI